MSACVLFNAVFNAIDESVEFSTEWKNSTGYLDGVFKEELCEQLKPGAMVKFIDDFGRKAIMVGTRFGNAVVFQRYKDNEDVFVTNGPSVFYRLTHLPTTGGWGEAEMFRFLGGWGKGAGSANIGHHIEWMAKKLA